MTGPDSELPTPVPSSHRLWHGVSLLVIVIAGALVYGNALDGEFLLDDIGHIPDNPHIRMTELTPGALREAAFESLDPQRPVANVTLALNHYWAAGYAVRGYHVFNVAIHLANGLMVYGLAWLTFRRLATLEPGRRNDRSLALAALAAALVFTLHPLQTQAVSYVIQRMTSLAVFFYLAGLLGYVVGREEAGWRRVVPWCGALVAWLLALGSKQIAITLPVVVLLYELLFFRDLASASARRLRIFAVIAVSLASVCSVLVFSSADLFSYAVRDFSMNERVLTQLRVVVLYLSLVVWPSPGRLNVAHDLSTSHGLLDPPSTLLCGLLLMALLAGGIAAARRDRLLCFAVLWLFVNLALESSIVPLEMVFEHRMYLPMVGIALLAGDGLFRIAPARPGVGVAATVVLALALGTATHVRNRAWETGLSLWSDASAKSPESFRAQYDHGVALYRDGQIERAAEQFRRAAAIDAAAAEAQSNLGVALADLGLLEEATEALRAAVAAEPEEARHRYQLGLVFARREMMGPAIANFQQAVRLDPNDEQAQRALLAAQRGILEP